MSNTTIIPAQPGWQVVDCKRIDAAGGCRLILYRHPVVAWELTSGDDYMDTCPVTAIGEDRLGLQSHLVQPDGCVVSSIDCTERYSSFPLFVRSVGPNFFSDGIL